MPGGGSKPGERRGGRQKGTPNKHTAMTREALWEYATTKGVNPFHVLIDVIADKTEDPKFRVQCASELAPYMMAKLKAVEHTGTLQHQHMTLEQAAQLSDAQLLSLLEGNP